MKLMWLRNIFKRKKPTVLREWRTDNSILKFLISNLDQDGNLADTASDLPDEIIGDDKIRFAPGLLDAMFGSASSDNSKEQLAELTMHLKRVSIYGDKTSEQEFYQLITKNESAIGIIDDFLKAVVSERLPVNPYLYNYANDLATKSAHRNAVKFGIAILRLCQNKDAINDLKILGLHDEFTVFAAIALASLSENAENDLWNLAKKVHGWGKIQLVDRLASPALSEPVKDWLIYEGYKNTIMYEYLAYTCAINGELHKKLQAIYIEHNLFKSASDLIGSLIASSRPAEDITTYPFASQVIPDFVRHAQTHASEAADFNVLLNVKDFLIQLQKEIGAEDQNGWTQEIISNCIIDIVEILDGKDWKVVVFNGLKSKDNSQYWDAKQAAGRLDIDLWPFAWARLQEMPFDGSCWYDVTHSCKPEHCEMIVDFALTHLPLQEMATGPKDSMGYGKDYSKFDSLVNVVTYLKSHPKKGEKIILTALQSPVTRARNMAIITLDNWKRENWSPEIDKTIRDLQEIEPNSDTKENIERLIRGQALK